MAVSIDVQRSATVGDARREIAEQIQGYIARNLLFSDGEVDLDGDVSFLEEGIIDSLGVLELVSFIEKQFGVGVADDELIPDNFDSVNSLTSFVCRKLHRAVG